MKYILTLVFALTLVACADEHDDGTPSLVDELADAGSWPAEHDAAGSGAAGATSRFDDDDEELAGSGAAGNGDDEQPLAGSGAAGTVPVEQPAGTGGAAGMAGSSPAGSGAAGQAGSAAAGSGGAAGSAGTMAAAGASGAAGSAGAAGGPSPSTPAKFCRLSSGARVGCDDESHMLYSQWVLSWRSDAHTTSACTATPAPCPAGNTCKLTRPGTSDVQSGVCQ